MISEEEARSKILETIQRLPARRVPLASAVDCFAAEDFFARVPLPNFDNSAMDGYAVVTSSCARGTRLRVIGEQPAGIDRHFRVNPGEVVRIFTGAPIPAGADAVVMQEDVALEDSDIIVQADVELGEFVRKRGCDLAEGQKILLAGERIRAATAALLASQGFAEVAVGGEVTAGIVSTGDELARPGTKLQPGQIYESNSVLLAALLQRASAIVNSVEHCCDDFGSLCNAIKRGANTRILVISGGVSVGEHDFVQRALESLGARIEIWRVAIKPGKPFLFARINPTLAGPSPQSSNRDRDQGGALRERGEAPGEGSVQDNDGCFVFGLPGNPVSSFVTFLRFVRPAILKMMGAAELEPPKVPAKLTVDLRNSDKQRPHYVRGKFENGTFVPIGRQESHALFGLSQSNALVRVPAGGELNRGSEVDAEVWD